MPHRFFQAAAAILLIWWHEPRPQIRLSPRLIQAYQSQRHNRPPIVSAVEKGQDQIADLEKMIFSSTLATT